MSWFAGLLIGLQEIREHKFRSFLTMLGVILGVASLLAMFGLTAGIASSWRTTMQQMGGLERIGVIDAEVSLELADLAALSPGRTLADAEALRASSRFISHVSPEMQTGATLSATDGATITGRITGAWPDNLVVSQHEVQSGRFITPLDVERGSRVVVLGSTAARDLWPSEPEADRVGRTITINGRPFTVAGILVHYQREEDRQRNLRRGSTSPGSQRGGSVSLAGGRGMGGARRDPFQWKNNSIIVPLTTFYHEFRSGTEDAAPLAMAKIDQLNFRVRDLSHFREALDEASSVLRQAHRGIDDYGFDTREDWFDRMETSLRATQLSGGLIAGVSLLVGGIGIANIMLASIAQRVRELGVRLAVGARRRDIFLQILAESTVIGVLGGFLGLGAGVLLLKLLGAIAPMDNPPVVELSAILISVGFATVVGVLSGLYPAWRASNLDPISALRYE
ncbi:MAG: ABC transporter permease [Chthoniobacterales bacterium]|nr:ABC transporter permease [Chthoniobacterales bacterium]